MTSPILILGGYGNFGRRIAKALVACGHTILINGRSTDKAQALVDELGPLAAPACFASPENLDEALAYYKPTVLINTVGPFQGQDYGVAEACINAGIHYVDIADGRTFVSQMRSLDTKARDADIAIITGASTVPGLSSAVLENYLPQFQTIHRLKYGISPGQKADRGLATTKAILGYTGQRLTALNGKKYGWQGLYRHPYPVIGKRWMANCDIPDLDLFPGHYGIQDIQFSAGMELSVLHLGLWACGLGIRLSNKVGFNLSLAPLAPVFYKAADWFNPFGSHDGGMHMIIDGLGLDGMPKTIEWTVIARAGDGPQIPCVPAILMADRLATGEWQQTGVYPALGLITLQDYLAALSPYDIQVFVGGKAK